MNYRNGIFITFEGGEGCGKTTIMKKFSDYLISKGYKVITTREPGGTFVSEKIREVIITNEMSPVTEALLFAAARREHVEKKIIPALDAGYIVLCDRFLDSSMIYQGYARGLGLRMITDINRYAIMLDDKTSALPDYTLFFDVDPEIALKRRCTGEGSKEINRLDLEKLSFHKKVYEGFKVAAGGSKDRFININADQSIDDVFKEVINKVEPLIGRVKGEK